MSTARRMQASLYDWIVYQRRYKAREKERRKGKEKRKKGGAVGLYKYLARAAKALVVSETTVENSTVQYETVLDNMKQYMP